MTQSNPNFLKSFALQQDQVAALPPEVRDQLMAYLLLWGESDEQLALAGS